MNFQGYSQDFLMLNSEWQYRSTEDSSWSNCDIPGSIYQILHKEGKIFDPFFSNNESKLQDISKKSFIFKTRFDVSSKRMIQKNHYLVLNGIDTYADLYLNSVKIGTCNNAFRTWQIDITKILKLKNNELIIQFHSNEIESQKQYANLTLPLPGNERVVVRKPQYHFGWDFGPRFIGCGIMDIPYILSYDALNIIHHSVHTQKIYPQYADIELCLEIDVAIEGNYIIHWSLDNQSFTDSLHLLRGKSNYRLPQKLNKPKLWWPNGSGQPNLYDTRLQITNESNKHIYLKHFKTGIRTINLVSKNDNWGQSFYFLVNNKAIFAKGANYIPQSIFQNRSQNHSEILQDAFDCHFNMLRIWGGGNYESDSFYETCDRLGIMIWHDFMYACGMYPGDSDFLSNARLEADDQVKRLSKFACIALWCGNNENNEAWYRWGWQIGLSSANRERLWNDYQNLFMEILPTSVATFSNRNSYWESSPLFGRGDNRFSTHGDAHDWGIWHDEMKFEKFEDRVPRFMSEAGFQSLPSINTVEEFALQEELSLESTSLLAHQKHPRGNELIREYLIRDLPKPKNFEDLIYLNQLNQAEGIGLGISAHRRSKPYCMGTLYWQFNDCWPGISWSSRDYFGRWKALQHKTKELYQPILLTTTISEDSIFIFLCSDYFDQVGVEIKIGFVINDTNYLLKEHLDVMIEPNYSGKIYSLDLKKYKKLSIENTGVIYLQWNYKGYESYSIRFLDKLKDIKLSKPNIQFSNLTKVNSHFQFEISSQQFVKALYLKEEPTLAYFPNYFDLAPGKKITITCKSKVQNFDLKNIRFTSLYDQLIP